LWKQFRRFGKDSGAPYPSQQGPNAQPGAVDGHDRLQLKVCPSLHAYCLWLTHLGTKMQH